MVLAILSWTSDHCPIYGFCKFSKPKAKALTRHIWMYNNGNFGLLRKKASSIDWLALENDDISLYASNLNSTILSLTKECIPNRSIRVRTSDPPWITTLLKRQIRKRKRLYRKAKQTNLERHWIKFRQLRNEIYDDVIIFFYNYCIYSLYSRKAVCCCFFNFFCSCTRFVFK